MQTWSPDVVLLTMVAEVVATVISALHCCCGMPGLPTMQASFELASIIYMHWQSQLIHQHVHRPLSYDWSVYGELSVSMCFEHESVDLTTKVWRDP